MLNVELLRRIFCATIQSSTFNFQSSTFNLQRSIFNVQFSTFNVQRSIFNTSQSSLFNQKIHYRNDEAIE